MNLGVTDLMKSTANSDSKQPLIDQEDVPLSDSNSHSPAVAVKNVDTELFKYSHGLTSAEATALLKQHGRNELPEKTIPKW
jgi:hypothetical protein